MGRRAFLLLAALLLVQTLPALWSRDLVAGDEVRHADALRNLREGGHALVLRMNGHAYADKPPLWFWVVAGIQAATGWSEAPSFFLASALASVLLLATTWWTARRVIGADAEVAATATAMMLTLPMVLLFARTTRMDALFAASMALAGVDVFRGLSDERRALALPRAALFAAIGALVKGPVAVLVPAAAAILWLAWRRRLRRLFAFDVVGAVAVVALVGGGWLLAARAVEGPGYVDSLFRDQLLGRIAGDAAPGRHPVWFYVAWLPVVFWPWTLLVLGLPLASRRREGPGGPPVDGNGRDGRAYLACWIVAGLVVLSIPRSKFVNYLLPLLVPACALAADALSRMARSSSRRVLWAIGALTVLAGVALPFADRWHPWPIHVEGLAATGAVLALTGVAVLVVAWRAAASRAVLTLAAGLTAVALLAALVVAPSLEPVLSPRAQARVLADAADRGAAVLSWRVYGGTYTYHAGRVIPESKDLADVERLVASDGPVAIATSRRHYLANAAAFHGLRILHEQWIVDERFVVLSRDGPPGGSPPR